MDELVHVAGTLREAIQQPSLAARVEQHIEGLILDGRVSPGSRIVEDDLARRLGVSRASLREAMIGLEQAGLVTRSGRTRRAIRTLTGADVRQLYEFWTILEPEAAAIACVKATADDHARIRSVMAEMEAAADDRKAYRRLNLAFHRALVEPCGNGAAAARLFDLHQAGELGLGAGDIDRQRSRNLHRRASRDRRGVLSPRPGDDAPADPRPSRRRRAACRRDRPLETISAQEARMNITRRTALAGLGGLTAAAVSRAGSAQDTGPIKVGMLQMLTGDLARYGLPLRDAGLYAVEEINQAGGINGRRVQVLLEDVGTHAAGLGPGGARA